VEDDETAKRLQWLKQKKASHFCKAFNNGARRDCNAPGTGTDTAGGFNTV